VCLSMWFSCAAVVVRPVHCISAYKASGLRTGGGLWRISGMNVRLVCCKYGQYAGTSGTPRCGRLHAFYLEHTHMRTVMQHNSHPQLRLCHTKLRAILKARQCDTTHCSESAPLGLVFLCLYGAPARLEPLCHVSALHCGRNTASRIGAVRNGGRRAGACGNRGAAEVFACASGGRLSETCLYNMCAGAPASARLAGHYNKER